MSKVSGNNEGAKAPSQVFSSIDEQAVWDDPAHLRGEILTEDQLKAHAVNLGRAHLTSHSPSSARPLRTRFRHTRRLVQTAYKTLTEGSAKNRDPSPAEVWLLDNAHVVDGQLREIDDHLPWGYLVKLPRMDRGVMRGYPLVYGLCLDYLRYTDCQLDFRSLTQFVDAYQTERVLTIGELWAVPIMLRLGLVLAVGARASSEANASDRDMATDWARRLLGPARVSDGPKDESGTTNLAEERRRAMAELVSYGEKHSPSDALLVTLLKRLRERDDAPAEAIDWIAKRTSELGTTPEELARRYHLSQAADQVSVGNAITSMRSINRLDWSIFFNATSHVEAILSRDPSGTYVAMNDSSRDSCRHAVERIARRSPRSETEVANCALQLSLAHQGSDEVYKTHVGYYLVDAGLAALHAEVGYRPNLRARLRWSIEQHPAAYYLTGILVLAGGLAAIATCFIADSLPLQGDSSLWVLALLIPALLMASSEIAVAMINALAVSFLPPRILPKLEFKHGLPEEHRTLVVIPTMLSNAEGLAQLLEELQVRSLANADAHLHFALLTDFPDAASPELPGEAELLVQAVSVIEKLNEGLEEPRYFFFHRHRVENKRERDASRRFWGWERKRGKLAELNRLLRGVHNTSFQIVSAPPELLKRIRYVITLDTDTELPLGVARRLVGTIAHPLNRPWVDERSQRVVRGHAIIQPRVGTSPMSARQSFFARLAAGPPGIDPYTTAVSDVYQDLFGEGSFVGKGIYDVDAFDAAMKGRVPENQLLSHDLLESIYARAALASDIEVLDEQPASYAVAAGRQHRWTRGDWQLLPWLGSRVPGENGARDYDFRAFDLWRVLDNLRRSLLAPALLLIALASWLGGPIAALVGAAIILGVFVVPVLGRLVFGFVRSDAQLEWLGGLGGDLKSNSQQSILSLVFLLDQAIISTDAIVRSLYRQFVTRQKLLEWTSMRDASHARENSLLAVPRLLIGSLISALMSVGLYFLAPSGLLVAAPFLLLWVASPFISIYISRIRPLTPTEPWGPEEVREFRRIARKTWRFFERFVGEEDNYLPPDNFQEDPRGVIAHRTSPTNIGLYLLSVAAARDLGFITLSYALDRWSATLGTIERMEKREGHVLNWYDTTTLAPLEPRYISTVDSGNLAGYLWTLAETCREAQTAPLVSTAALIASQDALSLASDSARKSASPAVMGDYLRGLSDSLNRAIYACNTDPRCLSEVLRSTHHEFAAKLSIAPEDPENADFSYWVKTAENTLRQSVLCLNRFVPHLEAWDALQDKLAQHQKDANLVDQVENIRKLVNQSSTLRGVCDMSGQLRSMTRELLATWAPEFGPSLSAELSAFEAAVQRANDAALDAVRDLSDLAARATTLVEQMDFGFLYDDDRSLFSIGYNVGAARLDNSHYDLLASEARLASLVAIAKGEVPEKHWFRLGRLRSRYASMPGLLSWSGSMFEYLMPLLITRSFPDTLLDQTYHAVIERQMLHADKFDVPWGISEAAYNVMDLGMTYQYRAFGVPETGLKSGLGEDLVVAPYATALAALVRTRAAAQNFHALSKIGLEGTFGYYESVDFTPSRLPPGRKQVVVKAFMAHHQGMTLVALSNLLTDFSMQRRFHADPRIKACALLLEERIPQRSGVAEPETPRATTVLATALEDDSSEHFDFQSVLGGEVRGQLIGQSTICTWVTTGGDGFTCWRGFDVSRFREDPALGAGGIYIYFRNLDKNTLWSSGYLPTKASPSHYDVIFSIDKVELQRRDGEIETSTEIVLSPEHSAEIRRITLTNHGSSSVRLDMTSFTELSLASRGADIAHPAFQKMFIETEYLESRGALIAHRRPRSEHEQAIWVAQLLTGMEPGNPRSHSTSRASFIGREGTVAAPQAMARENVLDGVTQPALDPALIHRAEFELAPGAQTRLSLVTLAADSRSALLDLIELFSAPHSVPRAFELAWADARVELRHLNVNSLRAHRYQRLFSSVMFPHPMLRGKLNPPISARGRDALWSQGISGDLPIVVLRLNDSDFSELCRDLLLAHEYWRLNGVSTDLVILNEELPGYLQPVHETVLSLIRSTPAEGHLDQRGGVFLRRTNLMSDEDLQILLSAARVSLSPSDGSLARQLRALAPKTRRSGRHEATGRISSPSLAPRTRPLPKLKLPSLPPPNEAASRKLAFTNGIGGFVASEFGSRTDTEAGEYVMQIGPGRRPPQPWSNVMAGPRFGALVTEAGSSFTWFENSQKHRLTPWSNDPTLDPSGELFFIRDPQDGSAWSLTPAPAGGEATYTVRHGQGYSKFEHTRNGLSQCLSVSVSLDDPVKVWHLTIHNTTAEERELSVLGFVEWVLGSHRETLRLSTLTTFRSELNAIFARNPLSPFPQSTAFFACTVPPRSHTGDRQEFLGRWGSRERPAALSGQALSGRIGGGLDPAAAFEVEVALGAGKTYEVSFILGSGEDERHAHELLSRYLQAGSTAALQQHTAAAFREVLGQVTVKTPDPAFDLLTNHWLLYQVLSCRFWGRSGFFQSGGAYGFRDQLQDSMALLHARPELARQHLLASAARQFVEGDVQHWWHADTGEGVRTQCSDDLLWLPWASFEYAQATGDLKVWDLPVPFLQERLLAPGEDDLYSVPPVSGESASLYEHCLRAIDAANTQGPHGLPLMRAGDWNDGMNRVGLTGRGESVWLGWFLASILDSFAGLAESRGDRARAQSCRSEAERLTAAIEAAAWDGAWYRRAFFDNGQALGARENQECRIDAIAQSWSVISKRGKPERAREALDSSLSHLLNREQKMLLLLTPPFEGQGPDPGYIAAYPPGVRENGGQYTHGILWTALALLQQGRGDEGHDLLAMLNPIHHTTDTADLARYQVEPYVLAADVYSHEPHLGRGGWTWYTGSASWMYRIGVENLLGLRLRGADLEIAPCVPSSWNHFEVEYRAPSGSQLHIVFENPDGVCRGVAKIEVDGVALVGDRLPLPTDTGRHKVLVLLGAP